MKIFNKVILTVLGLVILVLVAFNVYQQTVLSPQSIQKSFNTYVVKEVPSAKLIVFELHTVEKIRKQEKLNFLWKLISISDVDVEILVPVQYSFYIDVNEKFEIQKNDNSLIILAPPLKSFTPAVDVSGISFMVNEAPFLYDTSKIEKSFYDGLTQYVNEQSEIYKLNYQDKSSFSLQKVILSWLKDSDYIKNFRSDQIQVKFSMSENKAP